jgi:hypothetical protein
MKNNKKAMTRGLTVGTKVRVNEAINDREWHGKTGTVISILENSLHPYNVLIKGKGSAFRFSRGELTRINKRKA